MPLLRILPPLLALATLGCASLRPALTSPEHGGAPWVEVTSRHFVLRTDAPAADARAMLVRWERLHAALVHVLRPASADHVIEAVRFERRKDYEQPRRLRLLDRALSLDPLCWRCQGTRAELLAGAGRHGDALVAVDRAIALLPEGAGDAALLALRRRIEEDAARAALPGR